MVFRILVVVGQWRQCQGRILREETFIKEGSDASDRDVRGIESSRLREVRSGACWICMKFSRVDVQLESKQSVGVCSF